MFEQPSEIGLVTATCLTHAFDEFVGLGQHQRVGPTGAPGLVADGKLVGVECAMHVCASVLGERPVELSAR